MTDTPLKLFNSLTRQAEVFEPVHAGEARVYTCGPTVYNYPHIGNMRAYVFADVLGRTLTWKGLKLTHVINITDVGHLTDDADAGEDKMEKMAAERAQSIWDIAEHYKQAYWADVKALNIRQPAQWTVATDYVPQMIEFAKGIADRHCYELDSGLYFDVSTVADYALLAGRHAQEQLAEADEAHMRIDPVKDKRNAADFAIWRKTPAGESRQMEWDSPWGKGAPGWHLECSVMSGAVLGFPFDIHTGGIDHREIHHPNEIAQNQAFCCTNGLDDPRNSGAKIWMHNNFLVERSGKMSKSSGEFLRLQLLIDRGYHPLAYRLMCLQAHYRSELEFSWEGLGAALTRLKRMVMAAGPLTDVLPRPEAEHPKFVPVLAKFDAAMADDLGTPIALTALEEALAVKKVDAGIKRAVVEDMDAVLGLGLFTLTRADLRIRPKAATITEADIEAALARRKEARAAKDFAASDAIRDELSTQGVEVMDGDTLGWEWRLT
ncbi:cysteinyl-tRNA synthetase [Erythromicrobium ramosum]|uniref:Cysteine--tRNA ligase n=1 Tax=Erythrobacter ramosus TaxID=35811 RepID=A0A6I4UPA1_9SPHN|nr:cysteine--tRNA ligase [Erythrobacter ramosus]MBB3775554.1 cysteinyl-tRNA synthetase [Erythrobacter ramosus]MXP39347.1 cysteine--tRNA ligase [Erythrobacter ramosus]